MSLRPPCLTVSRLDDLEQVGKHEMPVRRVLALDGGRIAAIVGEDGKTNQLVVGVPGEPWERTLDLIFTEGQIVKGGLCKNKPKKRFVGKDPKLTQNGHGMVVSDGQTGVVALFRPDEDAPSGVWFFNAAEETEIFAEATADGVLVVGRWTGRDSKVWHCNRQHATLLLDDTYSARAHATTEDLALLYANFHLIAVKLSTGEELGRTKAEGGASFWASRAYGTTLVLGGDNGIVEATWNGQAWTQRVTQAETRYDVTATFPEELDRRVYRRMKRGLCKSSNRKTVDGVFTVLLRGVEEAKLDEAKARLQEHGADDIDVQAQ